jgi:hypothetical protein
MTKKIFIQIAILSSVWIAAQSSFAAAIPAGTTLVVRTLNTIHSDDRVGRKFTAQLDHDIVVKGNVVARAGTKFSGKVETSTRIGSAPLTLNLTEINSDGKVVPVHTVSAYQPQSYLRGGRGGTGVSVTRGRFVLPHGAKLEFRLAQPLNM